MNDRKSFNLPLVPVPLFQDSLHGLVSYFNLPLLRLINTNTVIALTIITDTV